MASGSCNPPESEQILKDPSFIFKCKPFQLWNPDLKKHQRGPRFTAEITLSKPSHSAQLLTRHQRTSAAGTGLEDLTTPDRHQQSGRGPAQHLRYPRSLGIEPPNAPRRLHISSGQGASPHPSPTTLRQARLAAQPRFSALVSRCCVLTWVSCSRRHGRDGTVAAPPSVGGAAATELGEGREEPLQTRHLTAATAPAESKMADAQPPHPRGKDTPRTMGAVSLQTASQGELTNRNPKSTEGPA